LWEKLTPAQSENVLEKLIPAAQLPVAGVHTRGQVLLLSDPGKQPAERFPSAARFATFENKADRREPERHPGIMHWEHNLRAGFSLRCLCRQN
jgi:hypothetical protein